MVAISLYRGNLHRVPPDVARRWLMPTPSISIKDFRSLLLRRSKALSLLASSSYLTTASTTTTIINVASNPNPDLYPINSPSPNLQVPENPNSCPRPSIDVEIKIEDAADSGQLDQPPLPVDEDHKALPHEKDKKKEAALIFVDPFPAALEGNDKVDVLDEKENRKREVEKKLDILNQKKHNLVQALKQILNAEEELKRRSSMQASRPPHPLQVDASNDFGSMTRHITPKTGFEANFTVDMEGDDAMNNNPQCRTFSTSPSAESGLRRQPCFQHNVEKLVATAPLGARNRAKLIGCKHHTIKRGADYDINDVVGHEIRRSSCLPLCTQETVLNVLRAAYLSLQAPHPSRAALVAAASPSRFAPSGNQGHPSNLPAVSVSGTNYFASSPSPAASGGTSVFRDTRHPSPWK